MDPSREEIVAIPVSEGLSRLLSREDYIDIDAKIQVNDTLIVGYKHLLPSNHPPKVSVAIAAATTSYARIEMHHYIVNYSHCICSVDTDGVKYMEPLPSDRIGGALGSMKFEGWFQRLINIAPKFYGGIYEGGDQLVKIKGLKTKHSY